MTLMKIADAFKMQPNVYRLQTSATDCLAGLLFEPEERNNIFLRNIDELQITRRHTLKYSILQSVSYCSQLQRFLWAEAHLRSHYSYKINTS